MIKYFILVLAFLSTLFPQIACASDINKVNDKHFSMFANYSNIIYENKSPVKGNYFIRIINMIESFGECRGIPETCPEQTLYIAVSTFDEYPEHNTFVIRGRHGWRVSKVTIPRGDEGPNVYAVIELMTKQPSKNTENKWVYKKSKVYASPWNAKIEHLGEINKEMFYE